MGTVRLLGRQEKPPHGVPGGVYIWLLLALIPARRGRVSVSQAPCPSQGCNTITVQRAGVTSAGHCFRGFNLLPTCPGEADIYLILIAVWPASSRKHCMLREDICFQAAYAKLQLHKGNTYLMLTFTDFKKYTARILIFTIGRGGEKKKAPYLIPSSFSGLEVES